MSYAKHNFVTGGTIQAAPFNEMDDQIIASMTAIDGKVAKPAGGNGTSGQVLQTNGDGTTSWVNQSGGGGSAIIDDTAGAGDTDKVWSADKDYEEINGRAPIIITEAEGASLHIRDGGNNRSVINMVANIVPVMSGSGTPSPTNVRSISGITGLHVYHSGADVSNKDTYEYTWTESGLIYLGYIDMLTGELYKTGVLMTFTGSETWNELGYNAKNKYRYYTAVATYGIDKGAGKQSIAACNMFRAMPDGSTTNQAAGTEICAMSTSSNAFYVATNVASTVADFKTYLSTHTLTAVGVLATPVLVKTFTAVEIATLLGENHIWSDYGVVSVKYYADTKLYADRQDMVEEIPFTEYPGYFNADGSIETANETTQKERHTERFDLTLFDGSIDISLEHTESRAMWIAMVTYDKNGDYIDRSLLVNTNKQSHSETIWVDENAVGYVAFAYRKYADGVFKILAKPSKLGGMTVENDNRNLIDNLRTYRKIGKPCYDHLYVENTGNNITIPHESLFHVRTSRAMGFDVIEANIKATSDGVYVVNHFDSGKFGPFFHHVDGVTDISDTDVSSVSWDWIVTNVRYNSSITKYQTRPARLEEFLAECRQQNMIPIVAAKGDRNIIALADQYVGKDNYIAYGGNRNICPSAVIYSWESENTKAKILRVCEKYGPPFIYGIANPTDFTDEELADIIHTLHEKGYWIGCSYCDPRWHKYSYMGMDFIGTQGLLNRIDRGNICNLESLTGFGSYTFTNATETNGVLTFSADGTIIPNIDSTSYPLCGFDLQMEFNGSIKVPSVGEHRVARTYTSDGTMPVFVCVPIVNGSPKITMEVTSGTIITDMQFKASVF